MPLHRTRLIVFMRAPRPGSVKTRLAAEIGADAACAAYRQLVDRLLPQLRSLEFSVEFRHTPDDAAREVASWAEPNWQLVPQGDGDLGARLERAVLQSLSAGFSRALIVGTDCPYLTSADLLEAEQALATADIVLGPAEDGGYWLIGLRHFHPGVFRGIPWSTDRVLATTLAWAKGAGLKIRLLRTLADVDTAADWQRYLAR
jgi:uncharacterized protein